MIILTLSNKYTDHALALHEKILILDAHSDIGLDVITRRSNYESKVADTIHFPKLKKGSVNASFVAVMGDSGNYSIGTSDHPTTLTFHTINMFLQDISDSKHFVIVTSVNDLRNSVKNGKIPLILHFEGARPFGENLALVKAFRSLGVMSSQLTWNARNLVADGTGERSSSGLSNFGVSLIDEMNNQNFLIDLSHLNDPGFWDVINLSRDPVVASHSNCRDLFNHPRNLTDEQIKALSEKDGVIGVCFYPGFIDSKPTLEKLLDHVDHIRDLVGINYIGVGPDFVDYVDIESALKGFNNLYGSSSSHSLDEIPDTTKLINFTNGLISRGYSDKEIEKIWSSNFLRVCEKVWDN